MNINLTLNYSFDKILWYISVKKGKLMLKKLSKSIREYKIASMLAPFFVTLEVVMEVIIPYLMANLIDYGIDKGDMNYIVKTGSVLIVCCCISLMFGAFSGRYAAFASSGFASNLRKDMFYNVQRFSFYNIDKFSTASIVTRLTTDVNNLQNSYQMIIRVAVRSPMMLIFSLIMAFRINPTVSIIYLCVIPILAFGLLMVIRYAHPIFTKVFKVYDNLNRVVQENLHGVRVVKAFAREDHETKKFKSVSERIFNLFTKAEKAVALNGPMMQTIVYTSMITISWISAKLIVAGNMTTGQLMSFMTYTMQILMTLMMLSMIFVMITISRASAQRIVEILDEKSDITNCENPVFEVKDGSIVFENAGFSYAKDENKLCLSDINLKINSGETIGIIGGTGSSKSTLIQLIPRLYDVTCGSLKVGGVDVREYDIKALRNAVSVVLQKNVLFSGTIKDNLRWGNPEATDEEMIHACKLAQADSFIKSFPDGYDTYIEQGGANVSGGQKQRLCIARALLKNPKILILDDSTSAVDTATDAKIRKAFKEEIPDVTKIIIAQRISSIEHADRILVLDGGKISGFGTHEELLSDNEIYKEVYDSQMKGAKL